jgi:1,4-alpha-glucan branching enzyme
VQQTGALEIIASAATHGLLPILQQQSGRTARAQVLIGRDVYVELFGGEPVGFWLPECGYAPSLESILRDANLRWFVVEAHGLAFGKPRPSRSIYAPSYTPAGPAAFARDPDTSRQVWSAHEGYPGDPAYRDFYRDIGFDLPMEHLGPIARGTRKFSGVKYHRITGRRDEKQLYDRTAAENAAGQHAIHFLEQCHQQIREIGEMGFEPIIVAPFDAELFGHWWFEGPIFLDQFIRRAFNESDFRLTTPSEYLAAHPTQQIVEPAASTWGENGHLAVWLDPSNAWIYPQLNTAVQKMIALAEQGSVTVVGQPPRLPNQPSAGEAPALQITDRVLKQLARELLLAQSSDWAFLMKTGTAREYATQRIIDHLARFNRLHDQFVTNNLDGEFLRDCEWRDNIFRNVNWRYYA